MANESESKPSVIREQLINEKEAGELKDGKIDRVNDKKINSPADLSRFLEEQKVQAIKMLKDKADLYFKHKKSEKGEMVSPAEQEILNKAIQKIESLMQEEQLLNIEVVRNICSAMSDVVGFRLDIDKKGYDQFGLRRRVRGKDQITSKGFAGYEDEKMTGSSDKAAKMMEIKYIEDGMLLSELDKLEMGKHDAPKKDIDAVIKGLNKHGKASYEQFAKTGPILVLLPEMHYDSKSLRDNLNAVHDLQKYVSMLAVEGFDGEAKGIPKTSLKEQQGLIAENKIPISAVSAESVLSERIFTSGVDDRNLLRLVSQVALTKAKDSKEFSNDYIEQLKKKNLTLRAFLRSTDSDETSASLSEKMKGMSKEERTELLKMIKEFKSRIKEITIQFRNQTWLRNIQRSFLNSYSRQKHSSDSNIVFLTGGAGHMDDLRNNAASWGFKGVVKFEPKAFDEPLDTRAIGAYKRGQLDRKP